MIRTVDQAQALVLSRDCFASAFQQILKRDGSADSAGLAVYHREACEGFGRHQLRGAAAGAIGVDEERRQRSPAGGFSDRGDIRSLNDDDLQRVNAVLAA